MNGEFLFEAIGYVGADLVDAAHQKTFSSRPWRHWGAAAAVFVLLICSGTLCREFMPTQTVPTEDRPTAEQIVLLEGAEFCMDGRLYYVDDYAYAAAGFSGKPFSQQQLQKIAASVPMRQTPDWVSIPELEEAVFYEADPQTALQLGQPVEPCSLVLALEDGLHLAYTYGEQPGLQYTYDKAAAASHQTLLELFVLPLENCFPDGDLHFATPSELSQAQLQDLFRGLLLAEDAAGIRSISAERKRTQKDRTDPASPMCYTGAEMGEKLRLYFSGCSFDAEGTASFAVPVDGGVTARLLSVSFRPQTQNMELLASIDYGSDMNAEKTYTIQFTAEGYRYLSIVRTSAP